jgi:AbrB family looped-hinge helix DNA binding protein
MSVAVTMSRKNQIIVPREAREKLHLKAGEQFLVLCKEDRIVLIPKPRSFVEKMAGLHREVWEGSDVQTYLNDQRESWQP